MYASRPLYELLVSLPFPSVPRSLLEWKSGVSPLSTLPEVVAVIATYLVVCFGGQWLMQDRKAFSESFFRGKDASLAWRGAFTRSHRVGACTAVREDCWRKEKRQIAILREYRPSEIKGWTETGPIYDLRPRNILRDTVHVIPDADSSFRQNFNMPLCFTTPFFPSDPLSYSPSCSKRYVVVLFYGRRELI